MEGKLFIRYTEDIGLKTNKGGLKHRKVDPKIVDVYQLDSIEHCPVRIVLWINCLETAIVMHYICNQEKSLL